MGNGTVYSIIISGPHGNTFVTQIAIHQLTVIKEPQFNLELLKSNIYQMCSIDPGKPTLPVRKDTEDSSSPTATHRDC